MITLKTVANKKNIFGFANQKNSHGWKLTVK